jgi:molybdate transport system substrate-binding protein
MRTRRRLLRAYWILCGILVLAAGITFWKAAFRPAPAARSKPPVEIRVFIPCGTAGPVSQALELFKRQYPGIRIREVVDKGKPLAERLRKGEACDVFIGRPEEMEPLLQERLIHPSNHRPVAAQILSLVVPADNPAELRSLKDLDSPRLHRLGIAPEKSHPGKYTRQALESLHLADRIRAEQVIPENADFLPALVGKGEVEAAVVFRSCVQYGLDSEGNPVGPKRIRIIADLPASSHDPITLSAGVPRRTSHPREARRLVTFLSSLKARRFFLESGFRNP